MKSTDTATNSSRSTQVEQPIRLAEVVAALSIATDLGTGQPLEHALRTAVLAVRLGELAGASAQELGETYYVALLHASGCTSNGHEAAQLFGDDIAHRAAFYLVDPTNPAEVLEFYRAYVGLGRPPEVRSKMIEMAIEQAGPRAREAFATMCEVAQRFAAWLGLRTSISGGARVRLLPLGRARIPGRRRRGDPAVDAPPARGQRRLTVPDRLGPRGGMRGDRAPLGAAYEPALAELAVRNFPEIFAEFDEARIWEQALDSEPAPLVWVAGDRLDAAFAAIAAITGLKSPWLREHSTGVAELAEAAAWRMDLPADSVTLRAARRARP